MNRCHRSRCQRHWGHPPASSTTTGGLATAISAPPRPTVEEREMSIAELERMHRGAKEVLDRERRAMNEIVHKITQYLQSIGYLFVLR